MTIKKLDKAAFDKWVNACIQKHQVFGVQAKDDRFVFAPLVNAKALRLDYDVTILPPKKYFLPPRETLLKFDCKEGFESVFDDMSLKLRKLVWADNTKLLQKHKLSVRPDILPKVLGRSYDHPVWEEKAQRCYSCGSCNLVCPTCYCFDVRDDVEWGLQKGRRYRGWGGRLL